MNSKQMHYNELEINIELAKKLIQNQFPHWQKLPIREVHPSGTSNLLFRLGDNMVIRLPRHETSVETLIKERKWLPVLASHLPISIPRPLANGLPDDFFPFEWYIYDWLEGHNPTDSDRIDLTKFAQDLSFFLLSLQKIDAQFGPAPGSHNFFRGVALKNRNKATQKAISSLSQIMDTVPLINLWEQALKAEEWNQRPLWIHGDLDRRNLLINHQGELSGVIDFGGLGVGDPACDVMVAWKVLNPQTRKIFRANLNVDDATWCRAKGWIISQAVMALDYYTIDNNPTLVQDAQNWLNELLKEE